MKHSPSSKPASLLSITIVLAVLLTILPQAALSNGPDKDLSNHLLDKTGFFRGVCSVLGAKDATLALEIARTGDFYVHLIEPDKSTVAASVLDRLDVEGLYGKAILAEPLPIDPLPYVDNTIDALFLTHLKKADLSGVSVPEVLRVLRPNGLAFLGSRNESGDDLTVVDLQDWLEETGAEDFSVYKDEFGVWAAITKPPIEGVDDWTHWEHTPDNNPVSTDEVIKAPYMTQFLAEPYYIAMPAITTAAGGRTFIAMGHIAHHKREEPWLNTLLARNGYNGTVLWTRKLPDGYLVHRSAFIATDDVFYMIDPSGNGVLMLEPETGDEIGRIRPRRHRGDWKWIAIEDGVLYALVGKEKDDDETTVVRSTISHWSWNELSKGYYTDRVPWGFGTELLAYDLASQRILWDREEAEEIDSRGMVVGDGKMFFYMPDSHVSCLSTKTGEIVWTNEDPKVRELIEEEGKGLTSTPGFRSNCFSIYTPEALVFQAQTRMNVVALSTKDGEMLWTHKKTSNNPNLMYLDGKLIVGIGPNGSTVVMDPVTGEIEEDLGFEKRSCARLTATPDSLFVRGMPDGLTRFDRETKEIQFNAAFRPSCNDGMVPANGLLYTGPWLCDCNLTLMGRIALCSADDFKFDVEVKDEDRLETAREDLTQVAELEMKENDWPTYRGSNSRNAAVDVDLPDRVSRVWEYVPNSPNKPTAPVCTGDLVFVAGDDGKVRAIDASTGMPVWVYRTAGAIISPPTIWNGRAYVGSGDGFVYCLEAATGNLLWRFRASPTERRMMVYGNLSSTWPVNSGVLIHDGIAYAAAGIIDYDGTYVYALDAVTGKLKWCNSSSGHLNKDLRKGVSAQGYLTVANGMLWMPGGNVISPAVYDLATGEYLGDDARDGSPQTNRGEEIGTIGEDFIIQGGRLRYSAATNIVNPGFFSAHSATVKEGVGPAIKLNDGKIPPSWNSERYVYVDGPSKPLLSWDMGQLREYLVSGEGRHLPRVEWTAAALKKYDTVSLALARNGLVAVCEEPVARSLKTDWSVNGIDCGDGTLLWSEDLPSPALPGGLSIDGEGRLVISLLDGSVVCYGSDESIRNYVTALKEHIGESGFDPSKAVSFLADALRDVHAPEARQLIIDSLAEVDVHVGQEAMEQGCIVEWNLLGPVPWDYENDVNKVFVEEPDVDLEASYKIEGRNLSWRNYLTERDHGQVDLSCLYGSDSDLAVYAYAEFELPEAQDLLLKVGTNDGYLCWFNGEEAGRFSGGRSYAPDQDTLEVKGKKGVNKVLLKVTQMGGGWDCGVRVTDESGEPLNLAELAK